MDPVEAFANNVKRLRKEQGLTQQRLAELAGLHMTDIARIETLRRDPGIKVVAKIAYGLNATTSELMVGVEHHPDPSDPPRPKPQKPQKRRSTRSSASKQTKDGR